jgi:hypothetical protein
MNNLLNPEISQRDLQLRMTFMKHHIKYWFVIYR